MSYSEDETKGCAYHCQRCSMLVPVIFVFALIAWSYYAFIIAYGAHIDNLGVRIFVSIIYHILLIMFLWSYAMAIFTSPAKPPPHFYLTEEEHANMRASDRGREVLQSVSQRVTVYERTTTGAVRYCGFADAKRYDLGGCNNFKQVFGDNPLLWPFPVFSSMGDGVQFETRAYTNTNTDVPAGAQCPA
eukprot:sb/3471254/